MPPKATLTACEDREALCCNRMTSSEPPLPTLLDFVADENKEFEAALLRERADVALWDRIQGFYEQALAEVKVHENEIPIFQLLTFSHCYFLTATAAMMRCHLSEAFGSTRIAIDAALIGAHIISDRASQIAYARREKPFDNFARHLGNLIAAKKPLPHQLVPTLVELHKKLSGFSSHADVGAFVHRTTISTESYGHRIFARYFQCSDDATQRRLHALTLSHAFVMILDVFSDFLVDEQKTVPPQWQIDLHALGNDIEREHKALKSRWRDPEDDN